MKVSKILLASVGLAVVGASQAVAKCPGSGFIFGISAGAALPGAKIKRNAALGGDATGGLPEKARAKGLIPIMSAEAGYALRCGDVHFVALAVAQFPFKGAKKSETRDDHINGNGQARYVTKVRQRIGFGARLECSYMCTQNVSCGILCGVNVAKGSAKVSYTDDGNPQNFVEDKYKKKTGVGVVLGVQMAYFFTPNSRMAIRVMHTVNKQKAGRFTGSVNAAETADAHSRPTIFSLAYHHTIGS